MKTVARVIIGLWAMVVLGVVVAPRLSPASAEVGRQPPRVTSATTGPTTTRSTATTVTTLPGSSVSTTPTTKPTAARPRVTTTTIAPATTTIPPTTVGPLPAAAPPPVTLPLATTAQSGHVSAVFPILGGLGLISLIGLLLTQWYLTKPGRRGPTL